MKQKIKIIIFIVFFASFIGVFSYDIKRTMETHNTVVELEDSREYDSNAKKLVKDWKKLNQKRLATAGIISLYCVIVVALVIKTGPALNEREHLSEEDVQDILAKIDAEYDANNQLVKPWDEDELEFIDSLDTPVLKPLEYKKQAVIISWKPVEYAQGYMVYRKIGKEKWKKIGVSDEEETKYWDYKLESDTRYVYTVRAFFETDSKKVKSGMDQLGKEIYINEGNVPPIPEIFATVDSNGNKCIGWKQIEGVRSYRIYKKNEFGKWTRIAKVLSEEEPVFYEEAMGEGKEVYTVRSSNYICKRSVQSDLNPNGITL